MACENPGGWPNVELKSLATKIKSGATPRGGGATYLPCRVQFALIRSQNVFDHRFDVSGLANISDEQAQELRGAEVEADDVLLNITGDGVTFARACMVNDAVLPACVNQHVVLIRTDPSKLDPRYLAGWLALPDTKAYVESFNAGGSRRAITKGHIESFTIPLPPIEVQLSIGGLLDNLNSRIDLLRQTNATLEGIAKALFKSWFVDFDPVRAKMEGRDPEGMDPAAAALFPCEFEESELGLIPKGWRVSSLAQHLDVCRGLSYKGAGLCKPEDGLPMHNLNSVLEGGGYKYEGMKGYAGSHKERHLVGVGEIIVANTEQGHNHRLIGFPAIVPKRYATGIYSHHLYRVRLRAESPLTIEWLYRCLMVPGVRDQIVGCANGSTVNMLKPAGLEIPRFVLPGSELCKAYRGITRPLHERMEANVDASRVLADLRDTLLPRLISGKLRLPEAAELVEEATT